MNTDNLIDEDYLLRPSTVEIIEDYAREKRVTDDDAVDLIVYEWKMLKGSCEPNRQQRIHDSALMVLRLEELSEIASTLDHELSQFWLDVRDKNRQAKKEEAI